MKRRIFAGFIASAMMASMLAGCGGSSGSNGNAQGGDKASGDGYSMTLIMSLRDEFLSTLEAGSKSAADELLRRYHRYRDHRAHPPQGLEPLADDPPDHLRKIYH